MASGVSEVTKETALSGAACKGCTYCCWAYSASRVPVPDSFGVQTGDKYEKQSMEDCPYSTFGGCLIHERACYPLDCRKFICPYLRLEGGDGSIKNKYTGKTIRFRVHSPHLFREVIEQNLDSSVKGLVFPAVPLNMLPESAIPLITKTKCVPVIHDSEWQLQMLSQDADPTESMTAWRNA